VSRRCSEGYGIRFFQYSYPFLCCKLPPFQLRQRSGGTVWDHKHVLWKRVSDKQPDGPLHTYLDSCHRRDGENLVPTSEILGSKQLQEMVLVRMRPSLKSFSVSPSARCSLRRDIPRLFPPCPSSGHQGQAYQKPPTLLGHATHSQQEGWLPIQIS